MASASSKPDTLKRRNPAHWAEVHRMKLDIAKNLYDHAADQFPIFIFIFAGNRLGYSFDLPLSTFTALQAPAGKFLLLEPLSVSHVQAGIAWFSDAVLLKTPCLTGCQIQHRLSIHLS